MKICAKPWARYYEMLLYKQEQYVCHVEIKDVRVMAQEVNKHFLSVDAQFRSLSITAGIFGEQDGSWLGLSLRTLVFSSH
jgi:hypothetical protein